MDLASFFNRAEAAQGYRVVTAYAIAAWLVIPIVTRVIPFCEIGNRVGITV
jgi:hypothetical protein